MDLSPADTWLYYFFSSTAQALATGAGLVGVFAAFRMEQLDRAIAKAAGLVRNKFQGLKDEGAALIFAQGDYEFLPTKIRYCGPHDRELEELANTIEANVLFRKKLGFWAIVALISNAFVVFDALIALYFVKLLAELEWESLIVAGVAIVVSLGFLVQVVRLALGELPETLEQIKSRVQEALNLLSQQGEYNRYRLDWLCKKIAANGRRLGMDVPQSLDAGAPDREAILRRLQRELDERDRSQGQGASPRLPQPGSSSAT